MELLLTRKIFSPESTIGELTYDGKRICYILEDVDRGLSSDMSLRTIKAAKIVKHTAIPSGRYEVTITFSNRFKKPLPLLMNVRGFEGVRIHPGNIAEHSDGCLLTGTDIEEDRVINSRVAFVALASAIEIAIQSEKVFIEIIRDGIG